MMYYIENEEQNIQRLKNVIDNALLVDIDNITKIGPLFLATLITFFITIFHKTILFISFLINSMINKYKWNFSCYFFGFYVFKRKVCN